MPAPASVLTSWITRRKRRRLVKTVRKGATQQDIVSTLGPPDDTIACDWEADKIADGYESASTMLVYRTGTREWYYFCMMQDNLYSYAFTRTDPFPSWIKEASHG